MKILRIMMLAMGVMLVAGQGAAPAWAAGDPAKGKKVFNKCKACHKLVAGKKAIGPSLFGLFGRAAGTAKGYKFSKDMKAAGAKGLVWDDASFLAFITKPKAYVGKQLGKKKGRIKMAFGGLKRQKQRDDLLAYLKEATK